MTDIRNNFDKKHFFSDCLKDLACLTARRASGKRWLAIAGACVMLSPSVSPDALGQSHYSTSTEAMSFFNQGLVEEQNERWTQAEESYRRAIRLDSDMRRAYARLGYVMYVQKKYDDAIDFLDKVIKSYPDETEIQLVLGLNLFQAGKKKEAQSILSGIATLGDDHPEVFFLMGKLSLDQERYTEARNYFAHYVTLQPEDGQGIRALILASIYNKDFEEAKNNLNLVLEKSPDDFTANVNMGHVLYELGEIDDAVSYYQKALELQPSRLDLIYTVGSVYFLKRDFAKAIENFNLLLSKNPEHFGALYYRADSYLKLDKVDKAREEFASLLSLKPTYRYSNLKLAHIAILRGDEKSAVRLIHDTLKKEEQYKKSTSDIFVNYAAYLYMLMGKNEEALQMQEKIVANNPKNPVYALFLARNYIALDRIEEALGIAQKIYELHPDNAKGRELLSYLHFRIADKKIAEGKAEEAENHFKSAESLGIHTTEAICAVAQLSINAGDIDKATAIVASAEENTLKSAPMILLGAELHLLNGEIEQAVSKLSVLLEEDRMSAAAWYLLSISKLWSADWEGAENAYASGEKLGLYHPKLRGLLALRGAMNAAKIKDGVKFKEALSVATYEQDTLDDADKVRIDYLNAHQLIREKKYSQAIKALEKVNSAYQALPSAEKQNFVVGGNLNLDYEMAVLYTELGRTDSALALIQNKRGSEYAAIEHNLRRQIAHNSFNDKKYAKAKDQLGALKNNGSADNVDNYNYEILMAAMNRPADDNLLRNFANQGNAEAVLNYAIYLDAVNQNEEAKKYYQKYLQGDAKFRKEVEKIVETKERVWGK